LGRKDKFIIRFWLIELNTLFNSPSESEKESLSFNARLKFKKMKDYCLGGDNEIRFAIVTLPFV
jgi:hypothetical protein